MSKNDTLVVFAPFSNANREVGPDVVGIGFEPNYIQSQCKGLVCANKARLPRLTQYMQSP